MISINASECDCEDWAVAVTKADVNNKIRRKIFSFTESDNEWYDIHHVKVFFCELTEQWSWFQQWTELNDQVNAIKQQEQQNAKKWLVKNQADLTIFLCDWLILQDASILHSHIEKSISTKNRDHDNLTSEWISAELQYVCNEWVNDDHHMILQVTVTVWCVKNHLTILAVTNETAADSISKLCAIICKAADNADMWERKWIK